MEPDLIPYRASPGLAATSVVVVAPHPDDEVFGCGGAAALHADAGVQVHVVILTADANPAITATREAESRQAARLLGQEAPEFWNVADRSLGASEPLVRRLQAKIAEVGADLVYAPSPYEVHPDHRQASVIASQAVARSGGPLRLAFYEIGSPLRPNTLVDITPVVARKRRAMRSFVSQLERQDYLRHVSSLNEYRTYTLPAEVLAAEAFWVVDATEIADGLLARSRLPLVSPGLGPATRETAGGNWPVVSILIRSMDRPWLPQALDSVALQSYPRIEVVVAAATPHHSSLPAWCGPFPLRLVSTDRPLARSAAANHALAAARGDLMLMLDDDDWLLPSHIARLARLLRHLPGARAAYSGVDLVDAEGRPSGQALDLPWDRIRQMAGNLTPIHAVLFDAALVRKHGCRFDEARDQYEDWDFWLQIAQHTTPVHLPGSSAIYRVHHSSGVHDDAGPRSTAAAAVYEKWQKQWSPEDRGALMERIWSLADTEAACAQAQEYAAQKEAEALRLKGFADELEQRHERVLRTQHGDLARLQHALASLDGAYQQRHAELDRARAAIANALRDKDVHIGNLDVTIASLRHEIAMLRAELQWLPVRVVAGLARRVRRFVLRGRLPDSAATPAPAQAALAINDYATWAADRDSLSPEAQEALRAEAAGWTDAPLISVVMPVYNPPLDLLREAIASVQTQAYARWELCIADDASTDPAVWPLLAALADSDPRIKAVRRPANGHISEASNSALTLATGDFVALLDNDDILPPDALFRIAEAVRARPTVQVIYSDEDKLDALGRRFGPYFKPDWNYQLFLGHNLISHLGVYRRQLMVAVGGFRKGLEGSQDYDLALRCIERVDAADIVHIPRVLYHWRAIEGSTALATEAKPYALFAAQQALEEHLQRTGRGGTVEILDTSNYRTMPADLPACDDVSLVLVGGQAGGEPEWTAEPHLGIREVLWSAGDTASTAAAIARAQGQLIALVRAGIHPRNAQALRDLARFAASSGVASAGGTLRGATGILLRGALALGPEGTAAVLHAGLPEGDAGYMGRAQLAQDVSALNCDCVVLSRAALDRVGPLSASWPSLAEAWLTWSLQAAMQGFRHIWNPAAEWYAPAHAEPAVEPSSRKVPAEIVQQYSARFAHDPAYPDRFRPGRGDFTVAWATVP